MREANSIDFNLFIILGENLFHKIRFFVMIENSLVKSTYPNRKDIEEMLCKSGGTVRNSIKIKRKLNNLH